MKTFKSEGKTVKEAAIADMLEEGFTDTAELDDLLLEE